MVLSPGRGSAPRPSARTSEARTPGPRPRRAPARASTAAPAERRSGHRRRTPTRPRARPRSAQAYPQAGSRGRRSRCVPGPPQCAPRPRGSARLGAARRGGGSQLLSKVLQTPRPRPRPAPARVSAARSPAPPRPGARLAGCLSGSRAPPHSGSVSPPGRGHSSPRLERRTVAPLVGAFHAGGGNARRRVPASKPPAPHGAARLRESRRRAEELAGRTDGRAGRRADPAQTRAAFVPAAAPAAEAASLVKSGPAPGKGEPRASPRRRKSPLSSKAQNLGPASDLPVLKLDGSKIAEYSGSDHRRTAPKHSISFTKATAGLLAIHFGLILETQTGKQATNRLLTRT